MLLANANWLSLPLKLSLATNSPPDCLFNAATLPGDEADRCRWQMKEGGGRENNEQTRGALARRSMRRLFFRVESLINKKQKRVSHDTLFCLVR